MDAPWYAEFENNVPNNRQRKGLCQARSDSGVNNPLADAFLNLRMAPSSLSKTIPIPPDPNIIPLRRRSKGIAARPKQRAGNGVLGEYEWGCWVSINKGGGWVWIGCIHEAPHAAIVPRWWWDDDDDDGDDGGMMMMMMMMMLYLDQSIS